MRAPAFEPSPLAPRRTAEEEARDHDLGFGSVISRQTEQRLLNPDGSFNVDRAGLGFLESFAPYHQSLTVSWGAFFAVVGLVYLVINLLFAFAYMACGPEALLGPGSAMLGGHFSQAFFFSIQTFATIGYGQIGPNGFAANVVVTVEALVGLVYQALATGLMFARFSRPTASIIFSRNAVVAPYNNRRALMFRIVNRRRNQIIQLEAQVLFSIVEGDARGAPVRRYYLLPLERNKVTFFPLSWTIVHPIDEVSPFAGRSPDELEQAQLEVLVLLSGIDETVGQTVHVRSSYRAGEIVWNARFRSMFVPAAAGARLLVDVSRVHEIDELADRPAAEGAVPR